MPGEAGGRDKVISPLKEQPLEIVREDGIPVIKKKPFVVIFTDEYLRFCYPAYTPERLGYRSLEYLINMDADRYARPWALWVVLRAGVLLRGRWWVLMKKLYRLGIFHFRTPYNQRIRWRDLGLGPDPRWEQYKGRK